MSLFAWLRNRAESKARIAWLEDAIALQLEGWNRSEQARERLQEELKDAHGRNFKLEARLSLSENEVRNRLREYDKRFAEQADANDWLTRVAKHRRALLRKHGVPEGDMNP